MKDNLQILNERNTICKYLFSWLLGYIKFRNVHIQGSFLLPSQNAFCGGYRDPHNSIILRLPRVVDMCNTFRLIRLISTGIMFSKVPHIIKANLQQSTCTHPVDI